MRTKFSLALLFAVMAMFQHVTTPGLELDNTWTGSNTFVNDTFFKSGRPWFDVRAYGALCNGSANDTSAIQAAINAAGVNGGTVFVPQGTCLANVSMLPGVTIQGVQGFTAPPSASPSKPPSRLKTAVAGTSPVITINSPGSNSIGYGVRNLYIEGNNSGANDVGIYITGFAIRTYLDNVTLNNFAQECLLNDTATTNGLTITKLYAQNCLASKTRATRTGGVHIRASDAHVWGLEATNSDSGITNAALNNCAVFIDATGGFYEDIIGEISEAGICLGANSARNQIVNSRADLNWGHGWIVNGSANRLAADFSLNNGQASDNAYDGFFIDGLNNQITTTSADTAGGFTNHHRYGFNDQSTSTLFNFNSFNNVRSFGDSSGAVNTGPSATPDYTPSSRSGSANQTVCWKTATTLGYCSTTVGAGGACTCN